MKKNLLAITALCAILFTISCTKKGNTGPAGPVGPPGPPFKGAIKGYVTIYDQYGSKMLTGLSNIQVTLKGGATKKTDSTGFFLFDGVSTGTYSIRASGTGLGATMINNVGFISDTFFQGIKMSAKPNFNLSTFDAYHNTGSQYDSLVITLPSDTKARNLIIFVNNKSNVSNLPGSYLLSYIRPITPNGWPTTSKVVFRIPASDLNNANIWYGEQTYFAAYSYVVSDVSLYTDPSSGKEAYNAVGTGLIDSAIAP